MEDAEMDILSHTPLSKEALVTFGIEDTAYVRPVVVNGRKIHVIHAADGTILSAVTDRDIAFLTIRQYEMNPVSVH
jgi:hypothetical protein